MGQCKVFLAKSLQTNVFPVGKRSLLERKITWKTCNEQAELYENYTPGMCEFFPFPKGT